MWYYDSRDDIVWFDRARFASAPDDVAMVRWARDAKHGKRVRPGTELARLIWMDGSEEPLRAPSGCHGTIDATNRRIVYERLGATKQFAFRLKNGA
ncbi:MAG: hypothetical protein ACOC97_03175 [Myxococcota bacterium]